MFAQTKLLPTSFSLRRFCLHALFWTIAFTGALALFAVLSAAYLGII